MEVPKAKDVIAHAYGIKDRKARLRFIEIQMDAASSLVGLLWDSYSMQARELIEPVHDAAKAVCDYDWSDNDEDAVDAIARLRNSTL